MTLQQIRDAKKFEDLKPAIKLLCDKMQEMTWGEFNAYRGTLEHKAKALGHSYKELNDLAETYQVFGTI